MAFMSQEKKKALAPAIKMVCAKYGIKATLGVHHRSTLVLNISEGPIDFAASITRMMEKNPRYESSWAKPTNYMIVNPYHYKDHFDGTALEFLSEVIPLMNVGNFDHSDISSDYFSVGWYVDVNIGKWDKPYILLS